MNKFTRIFLEDDDYSKYTDDELNALLKHHKEDVKELEDAGKDDCTIDSKKDISGIEAEIKKRSISLSEASASIHSSISNDIFDILDVATRPGFITRTIYDYYKEVENGNWIYDDSKRSLPYNFYQTLLSWLAKPENSKKTKDSKKIKHTDNVVKEIKMGGFPYTCTEVLIPLSVVENMTGINSKTIKKNKDIKISGSNIVWYHCTKNKLEIPKLSKADSKKQHDLDMARWIKSGGTLD